jgi:hypothetical protein
MNFKFKRFFCLEKYLRKNNINYIVKFYLITAAFDRDGHDNTNVSSSSDILLIVFKFDVICRCRYDRGWPRKGNINSNRKCRPIWDNTAYKKNREACRGSEHWATSGATKTGWAKEGRREKASREEDWTEGPDLWSMRMPSVSASASHANAGGSVWWAQPIMLHHVIIDMSTQFIIAKVFFYMLWRCGTMSCHVMSCHVEAYFPFARKICLDLNIEHWCPSLQKKKKKKKNFPNL